MIPKHYLHDGKEYNLDNLMQFAHGSEQEVVDLENRHNSKHDIYVSQWGWLRHGQCIRCARTREGEWDVRRIK